MKKFISLILFSMSAFLFAQQTITLSQALSQARENNLHLQNYYYQKETAYWNYQNSKAMFMPKLNLVYNGVYRQDEIKRSIANFDFVLQDKQNHITRLQLDHVLFAGGKVYNAHRFQKIQNETSVNLYQRISFETDMLVSNTYYSILQNRENLDVLQSHLVLCQAIKEDLSETVETDILQWDLRIIEIEKQIVATQNAQKTLIQQWGVVLGIPIIQDIPLPEDTSVDHFMLEIREFALLDNATKTAKMNEYIETVLENNLYLRNIALFQDASKYRKNIDKADFMPTVYMSAFYELTNDTNIKDIKFLQEPAWQVGFNISIPIFHGFRNFTNYKASQNQLQAQGRNLIENRRDQIEQAKQAWFDFDLSASTIMQNEKYYNLAERSLDITKNLHDKNVFTNVALIDAQNDALQSHLNFINSIYDYISAKIKMENFKHLRPLHNQ